MGEKRRAIANRVFRLRFCAWPSDDELELLFSRIESDAALRADAMRGMVKEIELKLVRDEAPLVAKLSPL